MAAEPETFESAMAEVSAKEPSAMTNPFIEGGSLADELSQVNYVEKPTTDTYCGILLALAILTGFVSLILFCVSCCVPKQKTPLIIAGAVLISFAVLCYMEVNSLGSVARFFGALDVSKERAFYLKRELQNMYRQDR